MMFYLHFLSDRFKGFNVFYYVTFRAVMAAITAFALSLLFGNYIIRKLISLKIGQPIRSVVSRSSVVSRANVERARTDRSACL